MLWRGAVVPLGLVALAAAAGKKESNAADAEIAQPCQPATFFSPPHRLGPGAALRALEAEAQRNYTYRGDKPGIPDVEGLEFCQVRAHVTHEGADDDVLVEVWLPLRTEDWNGRFQATGGGGLATGRLARALAPALKQGYAASSTDGGHSVADINDASWVLKPDGSIDWVSVTNFATRSIVESVVLGKAFAEQFFGEKPAYSYWNGCSQGGRQGYMLAQQHPQLLDGILAVAPALSLPHLVMADFWPQLVMKEEGHWMSACELTFFRQKALESCDLIDGVSDGVISEPDQCDFDPLHVVGQVFYCDDDDDTPVEVSRAMANIVRRIAEGPRSPAPHNTPLYHGLSPGTNLSPLAGTTTVDGLRRPAPFPISAGFIRHFLLRDAAFNVTRLSYADYTALWVQAATSYGALLNADAPDLSALRDAGTKLLTWHGTNDPVIPYQSSVRYRRAVELVMGGPAHVDAFYRLFLAPGVEHCEGGNGPVPSDPLAALVRWVEDGAAPATLEAETATYEGERVTRELCAWPGNARYMGVGDAKRASSWACFGGTEHSSSSFEEDEEGPAKEQGEGRAAQILGGLKDRFEALGMQLAIG